ncbi:GTPase IMAP family member 8-like [Brachyhypopomus gauderio]|uniref:GTPase IMAP family member 8-like n=1 Tax=Brachyhypopomus gauderio TaxID=698409 RepID=UPI0040422F94
MDYDSNSSAEVFDLDSEWDYGDSDDTLSDLRIVLLGCRDAGKSSAGNTILGREEFELKRTAQCVKRQGEVAGRKITVVEAPGWWSDYTVEESSEVLKQEIVLSVSLCPPGPHVLLLVIDVDTTFEDDERNVLEGHMKLLTERVWSHTIILFTYGDCLGDTPIEQHIESEDSALQWLVEKCGNRYHVLNNENRADDTQVTELLEKIEEMVAANSGFNFEMNIKILQEVEEKKRVSEERGRERKMKIQKQRDDIRGVMDDTHHLPDLRIVLLGCRDAGKSSAGNTILGREEFELKRTAQCVKRQGEVAGRMITVVEAPGWWSDYTVEQSSEILKQEIVLSVCLCPPGPHVLLLVIDVDTTFEDDERNVLEGHMKLLTERVWSHTIVLFTYGDYLIDTPIEQHIESEDSALQWLVEKCGNRYHVLNNENRADDTQVTELLEKIEEMVAANSGCHFEMDKKILQEVEDRKRVSEEGGRERMMKIQKQRDDIRAVMDDTHHLSNLRIVLLGCRDAGKSSSGNTILGREEFELKRTAQCVKRQREVAGRKITVVEAPGWWRNYTVEESSEILKQKIVLSVSLCPPGPHVLLLVIDVDTTFKDDERNVLEGHMKLLTERVWSHTIILFTCGDYLGDTPIEQHIESEGSALQWLVEKCGNRYQVLNNENRGDDTQVTELLEKIEEMVAANSGCHFEMDRKILQDVEERKRVLEERGRERMMKVQKQRVDFRLIILTMCATELNNRSLSTLLHGADKYLLDIWDKIGNRSLLTAQYWSGFSEREIVFSPSSLVNFEISEVDQKLQHTSLSHQPSAHDYAGPADMVCDFCTGRKLNAVKSCLTCTASYCETHVKQHYTVAALQRHTLVEVTGDLELRLCQQHHRPLEVFCTTDQTHVCTLCALSEHRGHDIELKVNTDVWKEPEDICAEKNL